MNDEDSVAMTFGKKRTSCVPLNLLVMWNKLKCFFGLHSWGYSLSEYGTVHLDGTWPDVTKCEHCGVKYHKDVN